MFIVSQILLNQTSVCETKNISTYAIALGLTTYAIVYVYMLFYNTEGMSSFNNYIFYIIGIDLFLSAFYSYYQSDNKRQQPNNFTKLENSKKQNATNTANTTNNANNANTDMNTDMNTDTDQDSVPELVEDEECESETESEDSIEKEDTIEEVKMSDEELTQRLQDFIKQEQIKIEENKVETKMETNMTTKVDEIDTKSDSEVEMNQKPLSNIVLDNHSEPIEQSDVKKRRGRPNKVAVI